MKQFAALRFSVESFVEMTGPTNMYELVSFQKHVPPAKTNAFSRVNSALRWVYLLCSSVYLFVW
jgi:hypothetical protein